MAMWPIQIRMELEGESYRVVSNSWTDAVQQIGVYAGDITPDIPDFASYKNPAFEVQSFLLNAYPTAQIWCARTPLATTIDDAVKMVKERNADFVLVGGTDQDQHMMWARIVEETCSYVTPRDVTGAVVGGHGYMFKAEMARDDDFDAAVDKTLTERGMSMMPPEGWTEQDLKMIDELSVNPPDRGIDL